jgi:hypothetical protein
MLVLKSLLLSLYSHELSFVYLGIAKNMCLHNIAFVFELWHDTKLQQLLNGIWCHRLFCPSGAELRIWNMFAFWICIRFVIERPNCFPNETMVVIRVLRRGRKTNPLDRSLEVLTGHINIFDLRMLASKNDPHGWSLKLLRRRR